MNMAIYDGIKQTALGSLGEDDSAFWVSITGSASGSGSFSNPYALPSQALAQVTSAKKTVICLPGEYTESATITWPEVDSVLLTGFSHRGDAVTIVGASGEDVFDIDPSAKSSTFDCSFADLTIDGDGACSGIRIDNGDIGEYRKLILFLNNVNISMNEDEYPSIEVVHVDNANADFRIYCHGPCELEGVVALEPEYAGDRFYFHGTKFPSGINIGGGAVAARMEFRDCVFKHDGAGGDNGEDSQYVAFVGCSSETSGVYAAVDANDIGTNLSSHFTVI
jgi:hypothetical protein